MVQLIVHALPSTVYGVNKQCSDTQLSHNRCISGREMFSKGLIGLRHVPIDISS